MSDLPSKEVIDAVCESMLRPPELWPKDSLTSREENLILERPVVERILIVAYKTDGIIPTP